MIPQLLSVGSWESLVLPLLEGKPPGPGSHSHGFPSTPRKGVGCKQRLSPLDPSQPPPNSLQLWGGLDSDTSSAELDGETDKCAPQPAAAPEASEPIIPVISLLLFPSLPLSPPFLTTCPLPAHALFSCKGKKKKCGGMWRVWEPPESR